ncbi:MAG: hypothetical protein HQ569_08570 [Actinobacteria bacterium]|nr:hypothetical protein [Actinomycetota bacterium]
MSKEQLNGLDKKINNILKMPDTEIKKTQKKKKTIKLTKEQTQKFYKILKYARKIKPPHSSILFKSSFIMLISYLDFLISDLIHFYFKSYPRNLSNDLSIKLSDLLLCNSLDEAIKNIINEEIEKILFNNLNYQKKIFKERFKVDLKEKILNWNLINEAIERRNIIIHNDSKINKRYLSNVNLDILPLEKKNIKEGARVTIGSKYFKNVYNEITLSGIILMQCCFRKWDKNLLDQANIFLINDMYNLLLKEEWSLAERLGLFVKENDCLKTIRNNAIYTVLIINYCQALKWQNKSDELEKELVNIDSSTLSPKFVLGIAALKDNEEEFYKNVENAIRVDKVTKNDFKEWPLFRNFRLNKNYTKKINKVFNNITNK